MPQDLISFVAAVVVGLTLIASSMGKLRDPRAFVLGVLEYQVLPPILARAYGRVLPFVEFACGAALLAGLWPFGVGLVSALLFTSFLIAVALNIVRGRALDCHCFGSRRSERLGWMTLVRLCLLLSCAIGVVVWRRHGIFVPPPPGFVPALLIALGYVVGLYLLGTIPLLWRIWHTVVDENHVRVRSRRVSFRNQPLHSHPASPQCITVESIYRS